MNVLILGRTGQLAWELHRSLSTLGRVCVEGRPNVDFANPESIVAAIRNSNPDLIVNAAAFTAVDQAEQQPELAMQINGVAPGVIAEEAKRRSAALITYSTDYVFDGTKETPYDEQDTPNPINAYGKSKLAGDVAVQAVGGAFFIFRTSWVYGPRGKNFALTMLRLAGERDEIRVVADQIGAPTSSRVIADATSQIVAQCITRSGCGSLFERVAEYRGLYNLTAQGAVSWFDFASAILSFAKEAMPPRAKARLVAIPSSEYPTPAARPRNSLLATNKLQGTFGLGMPNWRECLQLVMEELGYAAHTAVAAHSRTL